MFRALYVFGILCERGDLQRFFSQSGSCLSFNSVFLEQNLLVKTSRSKFYFMDFAFGVVTKKSLRFLLEVLVYNFIFTAVTYYELTLV